MKDEIEIEEPDEDQLEAFFRKRAERNAARHKARKTKAKVADLSWLNDLPIDDELRWEWDALSSVLDQELKRDLLWHPDDDKTMLPFENGVPSIAKFSDYAFENDQDLLEIASQEDPYDSENLADAVNDGVILEEEPIQDEEEKVFELFEEEEDKPREEVEVEPDDGEPLEKPLSATSTANGIKSPDLLDGITEILPTLAKSPMQALCRAAPRDLFLSLARDLVNSKIFNTGENKELLPALLFLEVNIQEEYLFLEVRKDAYLDGRAHRRGKEFSFADYTSERARIYRRLRAAKHNYFLQNPWLKGQETQFIWQKFEQVYKSLTPKQRKVVVAIYVQKRTKADAARSARISYDSLRDRVSGAFLKFRKAIPELAKFSNKRQSAPKRKDPTYPLYKVDPTTGKKVEIPYFEARYKENVNKFTIKAWAYRTTPVPDFSFTDFFLGNLPKGHLDRISARKAPHDNGASRPNIEEKEAARPFKQGDTDEEKRQAIRAAYVARIEAMGIVKRPE